ncbi:MAG: ankyrin repeat domain-containing protein [Candidatus Pacebacteria bacterium]|nr:ankyrin repeat domain-containing protein [Candidatus Paceibacterota bacterium]
MKPLPLLRTALTQLYLATVLLSISLLGSTPSHAEESLIGNAVKKGDVKEIKQIIANTKNLNPDELGAALFEAAKQGNFETFKILISAGANANYSFPCRGKGCPSYTVLFAAVESGDIRLVKLLIEKGADPNGGWYSGSAIGAVKIAINHNQLEMVKLLVNAGGWVRPNMISSAAVVGNVEMIKYLIAGGVIPFPTNEQAFNPEDKRFMSLGPAQMARMLEDESDIAWQYTDPIASACLYGQRDAFNYLLGLVKDHPQKQEILNWAIFLVANSRPKTAAYNDSEKTRLELAEELIQAGADINAYQPNFVEYENAFKRKMTPFQMAIYRHELNLVSIFIKYKPNLELNATQQIFNGKNEEELKMTTLELANYSMVEATKLLTDSMKSSQSTTDMVAKEKKDIEALASDDPEKQARIDGLHKYDEVLTAFKENHKFYIKQATNSGKIVILLRKYGH